MIQEHNSLLLLFFKFNCLCALLPFYTTPNFICDTTILSCQAAIFTCNTPLFCNNSLFTIHTPPLHFLPHPYLHQHIILPLLHHTFHPLPTYISPVTLHSSLATHLSVILLSFPATPPSSLATCSLSYML